MPAWSALQIVVAKLAPNDEQLLTTAVHARCPFSTHNDDLDELPQVLLTHPSTNHYATKSTLRLHE